MHQSMSDGSSTSRKPFTGQFTGSSPGLYKRDGLALGTTTYFSQSSDGTLVYPSNHVRNFHMVGDQLRYIFKYSAKDPNSFLSIPAFNNSYDTMPHLQCYSKSVAGSDTEQVLEVKRY